MTRRRIGGLRRLALATLAALLVGAPLPARLAAAPLALSPTTLSAAGQPDLTVATQLRGQGRAERRRGRARRPLVRSGPRKKDRDFADRRDRRRDFPDRDRADRDRAERNRDGPRGPLRRMACLGGRAVGGSCVCRAGAIRRALGPQRFGCLGIAGRAGVRAPLLLARPPSAPPAAYPVTPITYPAEVLVTIAGDAPPTLEDEIAQRFGMTILERQALALTGRRIVRFRIPDSRTVDAVLAILEQDPRIGTRQPNFVYRRQAAGNRGVTTELQYALAKVELPAAHRIATGRGVRVAVVDTGIDGSHPDLKGRIVATFDATGESKAPPEAHGTAIAGIIAGAGTASGIAPDARILAARAFSAGADGAPASATTFAILKAIEWAVVNGARILNLSFAGPADPLIAETVAAAGARNVILVAAAGNGGAEAPPAYPAAYPGVIAVTAIDDGDTRYDAANQGDYIAVAAPGVDIFAPAIGQGHDFYSGTSFAAAHVSGILALMLERSPDLSAAAARKALIDGAIDIGTPGPDAEFGAGRANAPASLRLSAKP